MNYLFINSPPPRISLLFFSLPSRCLRFPSLFPSSPSHLLLLLHLFFLIFLIISFSYSTFSNSSSSSFSSFLSSLHALLPPSFPLPRLPLRAKLHKHCILQELRRPQHSAPCNKYRKERTNDDGNYPCCNAIFGVAIWPLGVAFRLFFALQIRVWALLHIRC